MGMFSSSGSFNRTDSFLKKMQSPELFKGSVESLAQRGVEALRSATPVESGITAASWSYEVEYLNGSTKISWLNHHREGGVNIAVILQYGHGTGTGGYIAGRDYINPAIKPVFDEIAEDMWKKVTQA